jgi:hypothetical protein
VIFDAFFLLLLPASYYFYFAVYLPNVTQNSTSPPETLQSFLQKNYDSFSLVLSVLFLAVGAALVATDRSRREKLNDAKKL